MRKERSVPRYFLMPPIPATADGMSARIVDMSAKGARVEIPRAIEPGSTVAVLVNSIHVIGTVLWCQVDALNFATNHDGYLAGVAFKTPVPAIDDLLDELLVNGSAVPIEEMRSYDRFRITAPLTGSFGEIAPVSIVDISVAGTRIAMLQRVLPGHTQTLRFQVDDETGPISVTGTVMWCKPSPIIREHHAGLSIDGEQDVMRAAIHRLCTRNEARIDLDSLKRKFDAMRLVASLDERRKVAV